MKVIFAIVAGIALSLGLSLYARRSVRKIRFQQPDRELINLKLQFQNAGRAFIGVQVLSAIGMGGLVALGHVKDQESLFAIFCFVIFFCLGMRQMFSELRIAAETELEYRKFHPQSDVGEARQA